MRKSTAALIAFTIFTILLSACDKAPGGVIHEGDMAKLLADFAIAEGIIEQNPTMYPDDSSKLALKQSILKKYDADLAMYDSSLVWYAHNLKLYSQVHDEAVAILEKKGNIKYTKSVNEWIDKTGSPATGMMFNAERRVFPTTGDSANVWKEPSQWILTSGLKQGYITWDYKPDNEGRSGDLYSLNMKMLNSSGNSIKIMLAIDYNDGTTAYINRTANIFGWSSFSIQADSTRNINRIYGFIHYEVKPHEVVVLDSIYMLRTHLDATKYNMIGIQRMAGPKAIIEKDKEEKENENQPLPSIPKPQSGTPSFPGMPADTSNRRRIPKGSAFKPKPGLNKSVIPSRNRVVNPNGAHVPKAPIQ